MPKLQEILTTVAIVCHHYERLAVLQNFFAIILLLASEGVEKRFGELYTRKIKKKRRRRDEKWRLWFEKHLNWHKSSKSQAIRGKFVIFPFCAVGMFSNRSQRTPKCGKNISDTLTCGSCATSLFLPHFEVICDLILNRRTATWNLFVKLPSFKDDSGATDFDADLVMI